MDRWPELPGPGPADDLGVERVLRTWEHSRRLERELLGGDA